MMIEMNNPVVAGQVCLTSARVVPNPNKAAPGGCPRNFVNVVGKGKLGGNIFISSPPQLVAAATTPIPIPIPIPIQRRRRRLMATSNSNADMANNNKICPFIPSSSSYGDPCLDLFFNVLRPDDWRYTNPPCLKYLKQLLPLAWSHNPLTTLKLIFSVDSIGFCDTKFDTAVLWLHQNHPKTLLHNLHSIADSDLPGDWSLYRLVEILYHVLVQKRDRQDDEAAAHLGLHPERYDRDPDYRLLHDRVMHIFVERLKSDINKMKQNKLKPKPSDYLTNGDDDDDQNDCDHLDVDCFVSAAAQCCTEKDPKNAHRTRAVFLRESIGRRLLPPESDQSEGWERLRKEVLVPLTEYYDRQWRDLFAAEREGCVVKKYLEEVKATAAAGGNLRGGIIKRDVLLPNEIIKYVRKGDVREGAELQWKAMVEDIKQQQTPGEGLGKFKNCLVVGYDALSYPEQNYPEEAYAEAGLKIMVSEVSEEPWKGKMIKYSGGIYQLELIQGHDLTSKFEFMRSVRTSRVGRNKECEILKVFDLILEVAVNENLKAEQMIKKVIMFTDFLEPPDSRIWGIQYDTLRNYFEEIRSKFRNKGYGDEAIPHILYLNEDEHPWICTQHPRFTIMSGFSDNIYMFKSFLKNGGEIGPHHLMEAAITHKEEFQTLEVVD